MTTKEELHNQNLIKTKEIHLDFVDKSEKFEESKIHSDLNV